MPKTNKIPTLDDVEAAGVMMRASIGPLNCNGPVFGCTSFAVDKNGKKTYVIRLDPGLLQSSPGAVAPWVGHELRHVLDKRRFGDNVSQVKLEQAAYLREIYIAEQLKQQGKLCLDSDQALACQTVRLYARIWEGDLQNRSMKDGEFTDPKVVGIFNQARKGAIEGRASGTKGIKDLVQLDFQRYDRKDPNPFIKRDKDYLNNNSELDKVINQDDAFRQKLLPPVKKQ